jgi:glycosyltransferase involved in cell wall biosynthesis
MSPRSLADALARTVQDQLERLVARHLRGLELPRVFAGHPVGPDVRADFAFTLGHLHGSGLGVLDGSPAPEAIARVLRPIDGAATHTFYSYRVAETLARFGRFEGNPLLEGWSDAERENLAAACDSTSWARLYDRGLLPRNYAAVLARCELARERLGLDADAALLERMVSAVRELLAESEGGYLDDSPARVGRFDIYTADVYLFTEPLADRLGPSWRTGLESAFALVEATAQRDGSAIAWGRSTGALSACLTIELAALAVGRGLAKDPARWLALARNAFERFGRWMHEGLTTAHQHRNTYHYRGPARRLQMTLDLLGKLAFAALELRGAPPELAPAAPDAAFPEHDAWVAFRDDPPAGVWSHRSARLAFTLPVVGTTRSDYLPAPRNPGLFEVPVDADLPTGVPFVVRHGRRFVGAHRARRVAKRDGALEVEWEGFAPSGLFDWPDDAEPWPGRRRVRFTVDGATLRAEESLELETVPESVSLQVAETRGRPLRVAFECDAPHRVDVIDTDGLAEWRSFWAELPRVHQIDVEPAARVRFAWSVAPLLRVTSTEYEHHYHRSLYDPMTERVVDRPFPRAWAGDPDAAVELLRDVDFFHLHWPEWLHGPDPEVHRRLVERLRASDVRIVWTQHNRRPHRKQDYEAVYRVWAEAADAVIHHSHWGEAWMRAELPFGAHARHRVIPHGHFGNLMPEIAGVDRAAAETELGLAACGTRIGVLGAPRAEKRTQMLMDAFARVPRDDLQLLVLALGPDEAVPDDPRIRALPHEHVPRDVFNRRLATIDVLAIPIEGGDYLTTGQFADAVGLGIPAIVSDWPFLVEMLGDAALVYGRGSEALERCLRDLDPARLARAAAASRALQTEYDWGRIAGLTADLLESVGTRKL